MKFLLRSIVAMAIALASLATMHDFGAGLSVTGSRLGAQGEAERPDVIIILTDQQRADAFGAAGAADLHTPVMDRLARELDDWIRRTGDPFPKLTTTDRAGRIVASDQIR